MDATMVSTVPTWLPDQCANIFILFKANCCDKVARTQRRCHRHQRGPLNSLQSFLVFAPKKISSISRFPKSHRDATMVSTAPTRSPEQCPNIFILRFKKNCCDKVARAQRMSHRQQRGPLNSLRSFSFFAPKKISSISRIRKVAGTRRWCQRHLGGTLNSVRIFSFCG